MTMDKQAPTQDPRHRADHPQARSGRPRTRRSAAELARPRRLQAIARRTRMAARRTANAFCANLANVITLSNGVFGFLAIVASIRLDFSTAALFILCGVLCDWLDGKAARALHHESPLGKELDSLNDLVSFGVAPAILVAMVEPGMTSYTAGALFVLSAALRLGRFNVQEQKGMFFGVPTTTNGILLPAMVFMGAPGVWFPAYLFLFAFLMNAPLQIKKVF